MILKIDLLEFGEYGLSSTSFEHKQSRKKKNNMGSACQTSASELQTINFKPTVIWLSYVRCTYISIFPIPKLRLWS